MAPVSSWRAVAEFRGRRAPEYSLVRAEMDVALQDCPGTLCGSLEASTQTGFSRKVRAPLPLAAFLRMGLLLSVLMRWRLLWEETRGVAPSCWTAALFVALSPVALL